MRDCIECGKPIPKGRRSKTCCFDCALKAINHSVEQLTDKEGPYYDRWLQGMRRATEQG